MDTSALDKLVFVISLVNNGYQIKSCCILFAKNIVNNFNIEHIIGQ